MHAIFSALLLPYLSLPELDHLFRHTSKPISLDVGGTVTSVQLEVLHNSHQELFYDHVGDVFAQTLSRAHSVSQHTITGLSASDFIPSLWTEGITILSPDGRRFVESLGIDNHGSSGWNEKAIYAFLYGGCLGEREP